MYRYITNMTDEKKTKRINAYNIALRDWNTERKKRGLKWSSPKKDTEEYEEVQKLKREIEEKKSVKEVKNVVSFKVEDMRPDASNVRKRDGHDATIKKLLKINSVLSEQLVKETDTKKVLEIVDKIKENTLMLTKARKMKETSKE